VRQIAFPYGIDARGRTADATLQEHARHLIEQILFTAPGERVNRPDFGSGVMQMVFAPNGPEVAAATQFLVQGALQRYLGDFVKVEAVAVEAEDSRLTITVQYVIRQNNQRDVAQFSREV
jgi:phage baseplate assembly protein W